MKNVKTYSIQQRTYEFGLEIVKTMYGIMEKRKEFILTKQLIRSGTSIGANMEEAEAGLTKKEFVSKCGIALREARESRYWLRMLKDAGFLDLELSKELLDEADQIARIIAKIMVNARKGIRD